MNSIFPVSFTVELFQFLAVALVCAARNYNVRQKRHSCTTFESHPKVKYLAFMLLTQTCVKNKAERVFY